MPQQRRTCRWCATSTETAARTSPSRAARATGSTSSSDSRTAAGRTRRARRSRCRTVRSASSSADFNLDGRPDVATANQGASNVSVLLSLGDGRFVPDGAPLRAESGATGIAAADFNVDGRPDLAVSGINLPSDRVAIYVNTSPFPPPPPPPPPPPAVDADGDGFSPPADCNDNNAKINPGAKDKRGNKVDEDCKGGAAPFLVLKRKLGVIAATYPAGYMTFQTMTIGTVAKGDRIRLSCKGGGCKFKSKTIKVKKKARKLSIVGRVKGMQLRNGATFQLRVTRAGAIGVVRTWKVRAPKIPKITDQCLRPGAKKPSRCPR